MALIKCNECGQTVSDKASNCPQCGAPIEASIKCEECGETISSIFVSCPKCGAPTNKNNSNQPCVSSPSSVLRIIWKGKYSIIKASIEIIINGKSLGLYSYNEDFEIDVPIQTTIMDITLRCNNVKLHIKLPLDP